MIAAEFQKNLDYVSAYRASRQRFADEVLHNHDLFPELVRLCFETSDKNHPKACWILEFVCYQKLEWMKEYLDFFCSQIKNIKEESAIRPVAKICQLLIKSHYKKGEIQLSEKHLEEITETGFDWLINDTKVASKAYSIRTLYLLGKHYDWIHPELKTIITKDFPNHSASYKAVAKEVLKKIK
ncbi:hypothetical protein [Flavobacterium gilvum]|uniref:Adenylosuccinate lyase n=1 Tax=Flavobacterium gilvum TaxID=1492737 RepID=A0AAC9I1G4_9FLAO|nr:hypothetical protein [Flavobacterium gilvum]AOW08236.1 hypothetical protein EM308_01195 [Flavobacterium gilvum]KFC59266.1 hypothetical protein FEM08_18700 [Flavobacterium gilvum]